MRVTAAPRKYEHYEVSSHPAGSHAFEEQWPPSVCGVMSVT